MANRPFYTDYNYEQITKNDGGYPGLKLLKLTSDGCLGFGLLNSDLVRSDDAVSVTFRIVRSELPVDVFIDFGSPSKRIYVGKSITDIERTIFFGVGQSLFYYIFVEVRGIPPYSMVKFDRFDVDVSFNRN